MSASRSLAATLRALADGAEHGNPVPPAALRAVADELELDAGEDPDELQEWQREILSTRGREENLGAKPWREMLAEARGSLRKG